MKEIKQVFEDLKEKEGNYFSLEINQEDGTPSVVAGNTRNNEGFGVLEILDYKVVAIDQSPWEMSSKFGEMFDKAKDEISDMLERNKPDIEAVIDGGTYTLFSRKITDLTSNSAIAVWYYPEEEHTYILILSDSEEEMQFGCHSVLSLCRLDENLNK